MPASLDRNQICGMAVFIRPFQARTLSPLRRPRANADRVHAACRRVRAHRPTSKEVRTAARLEARLATMRCFSGDGAPVKCGRRPIQEIQKQKPAAGFPGAGFCSSCDDGEMPVICPTCQIFFWMGLKRPTGPRAGATNRSPSECSSPPNQKTRGRFPGAGFCNSCDDGDMPVICPTCQTFLKQPPILPPTPLVKPLHWRHGFSGGDRLGRFCHR
jgi:hypothetical protein